MEQKRVIAKARNVRGSARKARIPVDVVRGMMVQQALPVLEFMPKKAALHVYKVLKSAQANAIHNYEMNADNLKIDKIYVDQSIRFKRMKPKSKGMASTIHRQFSNITVELIDITEAVESEVKVKQIKEKAKVGEISKPEKKEIKKTKSKAKKESK